MTPVRRIALGLMAHAVRVFPYARSIWAEAMQEEMTHIQNDRQAFSWALGCAFTSYLERMRAMNLFQTRAARALLAVPVFLLALREFFAPLLTFAYVQHDTLLVRVMSGRLPGDEVARFVPLMQATPLWMHGLWLATGLLFLLSVWGLLRGSRMAFRYFVAGLALVLIAGLAFGLLKQSVPALREAALAAATFPTFNVRRDILVPAGQVILLGGVALMMWLSVGRVRKI